MEKAPGHTKGKVVGERGKSKSDSIHGLTNAENEIIQLVRVSLGAADLDSLAEFAQGHDPGNDKDEAQEEVDAEGDEYVIT